MATYQSNYTGPEIDAAVGAVADKYTKPSSGIPKTDLASDVQTSLGKADSALQSHQSLSEYRTASVQDTIDAEKLRLQDIYIPSRATIFEPSR